MTKASHAVHRPEPLALEQRLAVPRAIRRIEALRDHAVELAHLRHPALGVRAIGRPIRTDRAV